MPQGQIISHTSIRGIAALLVVVYHLQFGAPFRFSWETATPFFIKGYLWVDLFFILSGFIISYSTRASEPARNEYFKINYFYINRIARIVPLHVVTLFLLLVVLGAENTLGRFTGIGGYNPDFASTLNIAAFFEQLFLLNAWGLTGAIAWNIPSWSISAEMFAYLVFPILAVAIARWRRPSLALITLGVLLFYFWVASTTGILDIVSRMALLRCLSGFGLGMILYAVRERIAAQDTLTLGLMQAVGATIALGAMIGGFNDVFAIPGFFLLVAGTWPDRGWLAAILKMKPLPWLGDISYSIYLNHFWVLAGWHFVIPRVLKVLGADPMVTRAVVMVGGIALILVISHFTFHLIEKPARRALLSLYAARQARPLSTAG
ncbi:acyltransferase family protein [Neorhizobium tomejilense]|uniref:acyltransferase family protein n=1 Tax=Neorhizobium tomejilense TaxID=2093828 RepID=UPI003ED10434